MGAGPRAVLGRTGTRRCSAERSACRGRPRSQERCRWQSRRVLTRHQGVYDRALAARHHPGAASPRIFHLHRDPHRLRPRLRHRQWRQKVDNNGCDSHVLPVTDCIIMSHVSQSSVKQTGHCHNPPLCEESPMLAADPYDKTYRQIPQVHRKYMKVLINAFLCHLVPLLLSRVEASHHS